MQAAQKKAAKQLANRRCILNEEILLAIGRVAELLSLLQEYGFADIVNTHQEELLKGFTEKSIPPFERQILTSVKFSDEDFDGFVTLVATRGHEVMGKFRQHGNWGDIGGQLSNEATRNKGTLHRKAGAWTQIIGGALVVGTNVLAGPLGGVLLTPVTILSSVGFGLDILGDGLEKLEQRQ